MLSLLVYEGKSFELDDPAAASPVSQAGDSVSSVSIVDFLVSIHIWPHPKVVKNPLGFFDRDTALKT